MIGDSHCYRCRRCRSLLPFYALVLLTLVLVVSALVDGSTDSHEVKSTATAEPGGEDKTSVAITDAAKRLIRLGLLFELDDRRLDFDSDRSSWIEDLTIVLGPLFRREEIESLVHEAKSETTERATGTKGTSTTSTGSVDRTVDGECSAAASPTLTPEENPGGNGQPNKHDNNTFTGDRHAAGLLEIVDDPDCMHGELDASSPSFDIDDAKRILVKCRMLVLRNLFPKEVTDAVLPKYARYVQDIRGGAIRSDAGTTTFGGDYFILKEDHDESRFNYLATKELVQQSVGLLDSEVLVELLSDPSLLGEDVLVNHVGTIHALPGARAQYWHTDGPYVYHEDDEAGGGVRVAGHDLPPYAINMFTPLVPPAVTPEDGPTEFCLGSSYLRGHDYEADLPVADQGLLTRKDGIVEDLQEFEWAVEHYGHLGGIECPGVLRRAPLLGTGDALLFDYLVTHRGGANTNQGNPDGRSMVFASYSRRWFRDTNFDSDFGHGSDDPTELEELTKLTRYAVVVEGEDPRNERAGHKGDA